MRQRIVKVGQGLWQRLTALAMSHPRLVSFVMLYAGFTLLLYLNVSTLPVVGLLVAPTMGAISGFAAYLVVAGICSIVGKLAPKRVMVVRFGLATAICLYLCVAGILDSRPQALFTAYAHRPAPPSLKVLKADGTSFGMDGTLWAFTCTLSKHDLQTIIAARNFQLIEDTRGPAGWQQRLHSRINANWEAGQHYDSYLLKTNGVEWWIFASQSDSIAQFVVCTFRSGL